MSRDAAIVEAVLPALRRAQEHATVTAVAAAAGVYRLDIGGRSYKAKFIRIGDVSALRDLRRSTRLLRGCNAPAPQLACYAKAVGGHVACWKWVEGPDLRHYPQRSLLPRAFAALGRFHKRNHISGPVYSRFTLAHHDSVRAMLRAELRLHCSRMSDAGFNAEDCWSVVEPLSTGFVTITHGDVHPGNIVWTGRRFVFLDWSFAHRGLNLLDLDYVAGVTLPGSRCPLPWWTIAGAEAEPVLRSYLRACGLSKLDLHALARALMLMTELSSHTNSSRRRERAGMATAVARARLLLR
jgi:aminoglycoside phosphotransferase (APT) family kinase protein